MQTKIAILLIALLLVVGFMVGVLFERKTCDWNEEYYNPGEGCIHIDLLK
jgi:hypothetical protein